MGSEKIDIKQFAAAVFSVVIVELLMGKAASAFSFPPLPALGCIRLVQAGLVVIIFSGHPRGRSRIGLSPDRFLPGIRAGFIWSFGFAVAAGIGFLVLFVAGSHPFSLIRSPLPSANSELWLYLFIGGVIAPVAEELFFRGVIYGFFRRWGAPFAIVASTLVFTFLHHTPQVPITQVVGGLVFAVSYEIHKSLATPILIHVLGNLSLFALSLPSVQQMVG